MFRFALIVILLQWPVSCSSEESLLPSQQQDNDNTAPTSSDEGLFRRTKQQDNDNNATSNGKSEGKKRNRQRKNKRNQAKKAEAKP